jgi:hypothetical protein
MTWVLEKEGERVRFSRTNRASLDNMRGSETLLLLIKIFSGF